MPRDSHSSAEAGQMWERRGPAADHRWPRLRGSRPHPKKGKWGDETAQSADEERWPPKKTKWEWEETEQAADEGSRQPKEWEEEETAQAADETVLHRYPAEEVIVLPMPGGEKSLGHGCYQALRKYALAMGVDCKVRVPRKAGSDKEAMLFICPLKAETLPMCQLVVNRAVLMAEMMQRDVIPRLRTEAEAQIIHAMSNMKDLPWMPDSVPSVCDGWLHRPVYTSPWVEGCSCVQWSGTEVLQAEGGWPDLITGVQKYAIGAV